MKRLASFTLVALAAATGPATPVDAQPPPPPIYHAVELDAVVVDITDISDAQLRVLREVIRVQWEKEDARNDAIVTFGAGLAALMRYLGAEEDERKNLDLAVSAAAFTKGLFSMVDYIIASSKEAQYNIQYPGMSSAGVPDPVMIRYPDSRLAWGVQWTVTLP